jgi:hypothetical protein
MSAGSALSFNGTSDYVEVPQTPSLNVGNQVTVEFWMKGDPSNPLDTCCQGLVTTDFYLAEVESGGVAFVVSTDSGAHFSPGALSPISTGVWHHIAGTYDGSDVKLYVDGQFAADVPYSGTISPMLANSFLAIGSEDGRTTCSFCIGDRYFNGQIDEARVWDVARTQAQIQADMLKTIPGTTTGLVGYWQFNEGSGTVAHDQTAHHNDGLLGNGVPADEPAWVTSTAPIDYYLSIGGATVRDGNTTAKFKVTLSPVAPFPVTVNYATADGTATVADGDYTATSGTLTIPAGSTSGTISVPVLDDAISEPDEHFTVKLSSPTDANLKAAVGKGTILNEDNSLSIGDVTQHEGTSGQTAFTFTVTLSPAATVPASFKFATADGTAKVADGDYVATSGTLTIPAGQTSVPVTVMVNGDADSESSETFFVKLSGSTNAILARAKGTGTILDGAGPSAHAAVLDPASLAIAGGAVGAPGVSPDSASLGLEAATDPVHRPGGRHRSAGSAGVP